MIKKKCQTDEDSQYLLLLMFLLMLMLKSYQYCDGGQEIGDGDGPGVVGRADDVVILKISHS